VRQANIAQQQQVNNGPVHKHAEPETETGPVRAGAQAHARQINTVQNELLEAPHGNALDIRTAGATSSADRKLETVGARDGPRTAQGKSNPRENAWKGGHWLALRQLTRLVNAEVRRLGNLVDSCAQANTRG
jgi:hypothetical protein